MDTRDIQDQETLQLWLQDKPVEWAQLIAWRDALRVFPLVLKGFDRSGGVNRLAFQMLVLATWRSLFLASIARSFPSFGMKLRGVAYAARRADDAASAAARLISDYTKSANVGYAAARSADSFTDAETAYAAAAFVTNWSAIKSDCALLENGGTHRVETMPLWSEFDESKDNKPNFTVVAATPDWIEEALVAIPTDFRKLLGPYGQLIIDWYLPLLTGELSRDWQEQFLGKRAKGFALRDDFSWVANEDRPAETIMEEIAAALGWSRRDPGGLDPEPTDLKSISDFIVDYIESEAEPVSIDMIRARFNQENYPYVDSTLRRELGTLARTGQIKRVRRGWYAGSEYVVEPQKTAKEEPQPIEQGAGPKYGASNGRLDRFPSLPSADEETDPTLEKLHARIRKRLASLRQAFRNDLARYPQLEETLFDYEDAIRPNNIGDLDIDELWMSGAGLIAQARAFAALDPSKQVTEPLEPQQQALLGEIARLHGALIMGFAKGRELAEKSGLPLLTPDEFRALLEYERTIVRWLLETDRYEMSDKVRGFFESVDHTLLSASESAEHLAVLGYPAVRNLLIFSANALGAVERTAGRLSLAGVPVHLAVGGMLYFLRDNLGPILAFSSSIPELRSYLEYHLTRLEIDWQDKNADKEDDWTA